MLGIGGLGIQSGAGSAIAATLADVQALFGGATQGVLLAPSPDTCFSDAGRTIPSVVGGAVVSCSDLSGRGNHVTYANALLQQDGAGEFYIDHNGTSTGGSTPSIDLSAATQASIVTGLQKTSDAIGTVLYEHTTNSAIINGFCAFAPATPAQTSLTVRMRSSGAAPSAVALDVPAATKVVLSSTCDYLGSGTGSLAQLQMYVNGVNKGKVSGLTPETFTNAQFFIGARAAASLWYSGRIYGLCMIATKLNTVQLATVESYINSLTGAY